MKKRYSIPRAVRDRIDHQPVQRATRVSDAVCAAD